MIQFNTQNMRPPRSAAELEKMFSDLTLGNADLTKSDLYRLRFELEKRFAETTEGNQSPYRFVYESPMFRPSTLL